MEFVQVWIIWRMTWSYKTDIGESARGEKKTKISGVREAGIIITKATGRPMTPLFELG